MRIGIDCHIIQQFATLTKAGTLNVDLQIHASYVRMHALLVCNFVFSYHSLKGTIPLSGSRKICSRSGCRIATDCSFFQIPCVAAWFGAASPFRWTTELGYRYNVQVVQQKTQPQFISSFNWLAKTRVLVWCLENAKTLTMSTK